ncbi:hypothetical protein BDZ94DRAFT_64045 [Collybia nuda]|uniref:Uncharacterized protein n=1 Tax=Collybia nuda TaxID=64659 RepID=A0A9P5XYG4_9AGAR|nr:hypothetical protein BDZ94DRAFT_64045 [Collybia nuda]
MTRSALSPYSPKVAKKAFRVKAEHEGVSFRAAMEAHKADLKTQKFPAPAGIVRRNPGRMDGVRWNGSNFLCGEEVDGFDVGPIDLSNDIEYDYMVNYDDGYVPTHSTRPLTVSILDIARPAKRKGIAKDFEIVDGVRRIIALDDDGPYEETEWLDNDEWEAIDVGGQPSADRKSYSSVLIGGA